MIECFDKVANIDVLLNKNKNIKFIKSTKRISYANVPTAFDIETSSFYEGDQKRACMYAFVFGINGYIITGRTWKEFRSIINKVIKFYNLSIDKRMIIWVHNLAYEFQWICHYFTWEKVFAVDNRKPVYAVTNNGIEFRCSYILSNYSLEKVAENLINYDVKKKVGDLDYSLIRHSKTPLTFKEWRYIYYDAYVVMAYIDECIDQENGLITNIPLTKTGYVRRYCKNKCYKGKDKAEDHKKYRYYRDVMDYLQISCYKEYEMLKRAFQGGFTHANSIYIDEVLEDVTSFDFTSSYPTVMIAEEFPMSSATWVEIKSKEDFDYRIHTYCCLFDITFHNLQPSFVDDHPLSYSKCFDIEGVVVDNGRIVECEKCSTTITEQDYFILKRFYRWDSMTIGNFIQYDKGYLPTDFVKSIIDLYKNKTQLKDVKGSEIDYQKAKNLLNATYGMTVTDILRQEYVFSDQWQNVIKDENDFETLIQKYNKSKNRFLFYPWGVWVTAYARKNLFTGIYECKDDYIYSDTDSIKILNADDHKDYIDQYNKKITSKLEKACEYHHIPLEDIKPKSIKGKEKPLGIWSFDGFYKRFKTLGAKRYMVETEDGISLTVSGLNKKVTIPYLIKKYGDQIFDHFTEGLFVPKNYTGKNVHTYIDLETEGDVVDYLGKIGHYHEMSSIHIEGAEYDLSLAQTFKDYLLRYLGKEIYEY